MASLANLPVDLQIKIFEELHPLDLLSLRQTCKPISSTTYERIVWQNALLATCRRNVVFQPTFPIHSMSRNDLERAATVPLRTLQNILKGKRTEGGLVVPRCESYIPITPTDPVPEAEEEEDEEEVDGLGASSGGTGGTGAGGRRRRREIAHSPKVIDTTSRFFLVPGGRFLFTFCQQGQVVLHDIGSASSGSGHGHGSLAGAKLAKYRKFETMIEFSKSIGVVLHTSTDGQAIRFAGLTSGWQIAVYEIRPQDEDPQLRHLGTWGTNGEVITFAMVHDRLVWLSQGIDKGPDTPVVTVLDITNDQQILWAAPVLEGEDYWDAEIIVKDDSVIVITSIFFTRWPMPPLRNKPPSPESTYQDCGIVHRANAIWYPDHPESAYQLAGIEVPSNWYSGESAPVFWDQLYYQHPDDSRPAEEQDLPLLQQRRIPEDSGLSTLPVSEFRGTPLQFCISRHRFVESTAVRIWAGERKDRQVGKEVYLSVEPVPSPETGDTVGKERVPVSRSEERAPAIFLTQTEGRVAGAFCPFSGKVVVLEADDSTELKVIQFTDM